MSYYVTLFTFVCAFLITVSHTFCICLELARLAVSAISDSTIWF
jgi:hypothetical protein